MNPLDWDIRYLVHFDGATPADWVESSVGAVSLKPVGDGSSVSSDSASKFGTGCYANSANTSSQGVVIPLGSFPMPRTDAFTIACWAHMTANPGSERYIWRIGALGGSGEWSLRINTSGILTYNIGIGNTIVSPDPMPLSQWNLIEISRENNGTTRMFINGVPVASHATVVNYGVATNDASTIGCGSIGSGTNFVGKIDEFVYILGQAWHTADYSGSLPTSAFADPVREAPFVLAGPMRFDAGLTSGTPGGRVLDPAYRWNLDSGPLAIGGTVAIKDSPTNIPVPRRVRLHDQPTGRLVRETWSAPNGVYLFPRIADGLYYVVAFDHTLVENAAIKDRITPQVPT